MPGRLLTPLQDHGLAVSNPLLCRRHPAAPRSLRPATAPPGPLQVLTGCRSSQERKMRPIRAFKRAQLNSLFCQERDTGYLPLAHPTLRGWPRAHPPGSSPQPFLLAFLGGPVEQVTAHGELMSTSGPSAAPPRGGRVGGCGTE